MLWISSISSAIYISETWFLNLDTAAYSIYSSTWTTKLTWRTWIITWTTCTNINTIRLTTPIWCKYPKTSYKTILSTAFISSCTHIKKIECSCSTTCTNWILTTSKSTLCTELITFNISCTISNHALINLWYKKC